MVTDDPDGVAETTAQSQAEQLELLASKRRQTLLELLATSADDVHTLESLATAITQTEQGADLGARPAHRVCLFLRHVHLPKLDAADIVEYDPQQNVVECTGDGRLDRLLDATGR
ncbi:DUF7344 domain-containing protein [Haloarcula salinisoli]|uniref:DUF7344 domain-containing protein n=1 Tax=Haloarcula salinisoli TaxID=2487746 RepID=A0A8J7YI10_9EURY|nr:hypothetical protein [Halomicroarcula salinisoli]MBX0285457.1 hypothetical protein [Halomicroarcula salinisoli]MBX0303064.1 hypothetical protein [Halomicroarcula salinisoli]